MTSSASRTPTAGPEHVLIDVRCLQESGAGGRGEALDLLRRGRDALPFATLVGLIDPDLPPLPDAARACLDRVRSNAYPGDLDAPSCLVQLAPGSHDRAHDPLFTARLLLHSAVPSVALALEPDGEQGLAEAVRRYWRARAGRVVAPDDLWATVAACAPERAPSVVGRRPRLAVLSQSPRATLCAALREVGGELFGPSHLPLLSPRFDRVLFVLANTPADAVLIGLLRRHGGAAVLTDSCLLACYADDPARAARLAGQELGREISIEEMRQWQLGIVCPPALMLGEVAASAEPLIVRSEWLAEEIKARYGRKAVVVPAAAAATFPRAEGCIRAHASGLAAESCVWALELLRFWGLEVRLELACTPAERGLLAALAAKLGVGSKLGFNPGPAELGLFLAMRGQASLSAALADAAASGLRCIASRSVAEAMEAPDWVLLLPDQPSPPLLAEAIRTALERPAPSGPALAAYRRRHDPAAVAAGLCATLGMAT